LAIAGASLVAPFAIYFGLQALGASAAFYSVVSLTHRLIKDKREFERIVVRIPGDDGQVLGLTHRLLALAHIVPSDAAGGWALRVEYKEGPHYARRPFLDAGGRTMITGERAVQALGLLLPRINAEGGTRRDVAAATELIDHSRDLFVDAATRTTQLRKVGAGSVLSGMDRANRLALEMLCHEVMERRALEGELAALEAAWREAEQIAAIADDLFLPESVRAWMQAHGRHK
jgi:hypothetical protein